MSKKDKEVDESGTESVANREPRCLPIAEKGIRTSSDFASFMSCVMSDVVTGRLTAGAANAAVNAGGKLLKVVELQQKYGTHGKGTEKTLQLVSVNSEDQIQ